MQKEIPDISKGRYVSLFDLGVCDHITDEKIEVSLKLNFGDVTIKAKTLNKKREKLPQSYIKKAAG